MDTSKTLVMFVHTKLTKMKKEISLESIASAVDETITQNQEMFDNVDRQSVIDILVLKLKGSLGIGRGMHIEDKTDNYPSWLTSERKKSWNYWGRYKTKLELYLPDEVVEEIDSSTDYVLNKLGDPLDLNSYWDRRGLVIGDVQSGKTGNYTALINKAADAGYKIIIVLAGLNNNLRSQTQVRIDEDFIGHISNADGSCKNYVGVGLIDDSISPDYGTTRDDNGDFNKRNAKNGITPGNATIFVVKKNKTVLENLISWLSTRLSNEIDSENKTRKISSFPLLVIDDESDNGSVDTGLQDFEDEVPDLEYNPKTINKLIRRLLTLFTNSSYVGYTATPFANIFIHHLAKTKNEGKDLFPSHFVYVLPSSSEYLGAKSLFLDSRLRNKLILKSIDDSESWIPEKHDKSFSPSLNSSYGIPISLEKAIGSFILSVALRKMRGQGNKHCSMLINVSRFVAVQEKVQKLVESYFIKLKQSIQRNIGADHYISILHDLWKNDYQIAVNEYAINEDFAYYYKLSKSSFEEVLNVVRDVIQDICMKLINGFASDVLDYKLYENIGLKTIVVGGDKLSRGLTLEGLTVSYFFRSVRSADTLLQMGRWFGYRTGYEDLCRVYLTPALQDDFIESARISEDTRHEFFRAQQRGISPISYCYKIQQRDIAPTSKGKSRHAKEINLNYNGQLIQTTLFDEVNLAQNYQVSMALLESLKSHNLKMGIEKDSSKLDSVARFLNIPAKEILDFLSNYRTARNSKRVVADFIREYITRKNEIGELSSWTVMIIGTKAKNLIDSSNKIKIGSHNNLGLVTREIISKNKSQIAIKALAVQGEEGYDVSAADWNKALENSKEYWKITPRTENEPTMPYGNELRRVRSKSKEKGLLMLYFIDNKFSDSFPIISGFAVSFPYGTNLDNSVYIGNKIYSKDL